MKLTAELKSAGGNATGLRVPDEFVAELGGGGHPKVDRVVGLLPGQPQPVGAGQRHVHGEPVRDEARPQPVGHTRLVLDHQDAHPDLILPYRG